MIGRCDDVDSDSDGFAAVPCSLRRPRQQHILLSSDSEGEVHSAMQRCAAPLPDPSVPLAHRRSSGRSAPAQVQPPAQRSSDTAPTACLARMRVSGGDTAAAFRTSPRSSSPEAVSSQGSDSSDCGGLRFTRSVLRGTAQHRLSSSSEADSPVAATDAGFSRPARRLSFGAPAGGVTASCVGSKEAQPPAIAQGAPLCTAMHAAAVRWADAGAAQSPSDVLVRSLQKLDLSGAGASTVTEQRHHPGEPSGALSDDCNKSPQPTWKATRTPRRRRMLHSDSDSEAARTLASTPPQPALYQSVAPTPWRCTPPWLSAVVRAPLPQTPAIKPHRSNSAAESSSEPEGRRAVTPEWMSAYKLPPPQDLLAVLGNVAAIEAATAVPRRVRRPPQRQPPEIITLSSDDESSSPRHRSQPVTPRSRLLELCKENASAVSTPAARPVQPLQPQNCNTPRPVARPADKLLATTSDKPTLAFARQREQLAQGLFQEYNARVFGGELPADLQITWSKHLSTTAGMTRYSRQAPQGLFGEHKFSARVELSVKVLDTHKRLQSTLAHELCHVAAWIFDHVAKPPHGKVFYSWAARFTAAYPGLDITTCHNYEVNYAFKWRCTTPACGKVYGRHSNSLDVAKKCCGVCRGRLEPLGRFNADGTPAKARAASAYSLFVKDHYAASKAEAGPKTPHKDVMKLLAVKWSAQKAR